MHKPDSSSNYPKTVATVQVKSSKRNKAGLAILLLCLAFALVSALFIPSLFGNAASAEVKPASSSQVFQKVEQVTSVVAANEVLGFNPPTPTKLPEGVETVAYHVIEDEILEIEYQFSGDTVIYRVGKGNEDLSYDHTEYKYTHTSADEDGVTRYYAGASEQKLNLVVWTDAGYSFALVAPNGINAEMLTWTARKVAV